MDVQESSRSRSKRAFEDNIDTRDSRDEDNEDSDKKKHWSSKLRKHGSTEDAEEHDSGRKRSSGERNDGRRKSGGADHAGSGDEDDYDARREPRNKVPRKDQEERSEKRSSERFRDRDDGSHRSRDDGSHRSRDDENEWSSSRRTSSRAGHESSESRTRGRAESSREHRDGELEKVQDRDSRHSERKESARDKGHEQHEHERNASRRRWEEADTSRRAEETSYNEKSDSRSGKTTDHDKPRPPRDRVPDSRYESSEVKSRALESSSEKGARSSDRDERRGDGDRSNNLGRFEAQDEDARTGTASREARSDTARDGRHRNMRDRSPGFLLDGDRNSTKLHEEKGEKHRYERDSAHSRREETENCERSVNIDEDGHSRLRDRNGREIRHSRRSRTPERSGRHLREVDERDRVFSESDNERSINLKGVDREKESYKDDRSSKGRDSSWDDKSRDREVSRDHWRKSQTRQDTKDGENEYDRIKEWDSHRHDQERLDSERLHSRSGYRKDGRMRYDSGTDSIEIRPNKNLDFGKEESVSMVAGKKSELASQQDFASGEGDEEWALPTEDRGKLTAGFGDDDCTSRRMSHDSQFGKGRGQKGAMGTNRIVLGQSASGSLQPALGNNQGPGSFNRGSQQAIKSGRLAKGGRGRVTGRDAQRVGLPLPMMGPPPFGHLGMPPGPMQSIGPNMPPTPGPPIGPGVFIPPFPAPLVWPGARGIDMGMIAVPPNLPPIPPPGAAVPRFPSNMGTGPNPGMYFNQPSPGRGMPSNLSSPVFNAIGPMGRGMPPDKASTGWGPTRTGGPSGKAPSRGEQNDYSQNFVDTGLRPQNFIRELELTSVVEDYPKLRELIQRKDEIVAHSASSPMYYKCDLKEVVLSPEFFGSKFDVILVDPPWEEYVHRAPGITDHLDYWTFEEIQNLKIEAIADTPSFIFLWVGDGVGLEQGRECLKKWGFRRCEDICWVKTNKKNASSGLRHDSHTLFQHSKEHCLMGIKGTVRRSSDGHIIHANIDTDVIIAEEPTDGSTRKPEDMYRIIEHFSLGRRRLELFGEDHNIRSGWLTVGKGLSSSNFSAEAYIRNFADRDGKVWQGGPGRTPPIDAPHLVQTTPEIEGLRPKSPPHKSQMQSMPLLLVGNPNNRRATGNSPQNPTAALSGLNQDPLGSETTTPSPAPWSSSPMVGLRGGPDGGHGGSEDRFFDGYSFNSSSIQVSQDHVEFEPHRGGALL